MTRRLETQVARKPGVRVFCALLVAAPAFAALLATGAVVHRGRTTRRPSVSGSYAVESEPTPGLGSEQDAGARSSWFYAQRAYPHAFTPREALIRAERQATALKSTPAPGGPMTPLAWTEIGPRPIATFGPATRGAGDMYMGSPPVSGRVTALASDPSNPDVIYLGSAVGGVWKSTDGGVSWAPIFPRAIGSFSIGAIAVDPSNPQNVWVGTGDSNNVVGDSYYGLGIYKSTNGGASWTKVGGTTFDGCFVPDLAVVDSSTVVAAILEFPGIQNPACSSSRRGLWRTADGGSSWTQISLPNASHQSPSDLSQPQGQPSTIYLAAYYDGVFRSADGGATWTHLGIENLYRGAVSAYDANTAYVAYADPTTKDLAGVWKTVDGGAHWTGVVGPGGPNTPCDYNPPSIRPICDNALTLVVDPSDPTVFYVGGVRLFKYTNSGATATLVGWGACSSCIHLDQHASLYDASHRLWIGNDGGAYRSDDGAASFLNRNGSGGGALAISEFEPWTSGSVAGGTFIGGTQDDGEVKYTAATGLDWRMDIAGDGGATAFVSPTTYYATHFGPAVFKTVDSGTTFTDVSGPWAGESSQMYPPLVMSPTNTFTLYRGTTRIWKTFNGAESWSPISPIFDPPMGVSAIGLATSNPNGLYAGWSPYRGTTGAPAKLRYTTDGGATWSEVPSGQLPDRYISDIDVDPSNASIAVATFSGFGTGHVYRTTNGGTVWTNISGNLPDTPVDAVAVDYTTSPATVFVGTDVGVFWTIDSGTTWGNTSQDLPATVVMDLRIDGSSLIAATHGRGAWKASLPLPNPPPPLPPPPPPAPPAPPPPPPLPPPAPPPPTCRVPRVVGLTLARARPRIVRAHCRVGSVTFRASSPKKRGRVLRERPAPGRRLANRARVNLIVGKGPKKP